jgi:SAM-dependent methyltransferase
MTEQATSRQALRPCPICRGGQVAVLHHQRFILPEGHLLGEGYDVVCCDVCGFVYADTEAKQADYDRFYAESSGYESEMSSGMGLSAHDRERLEGTAAAVAEALRSRDARLLDFGCAGGGLIRMLQELGFANVHGIDPSPACAAQVRAATGAPADAGSLFAIPEGIGQFDGIILTHVLEHVEDVTGALRNLLTLLAPGGLLYLEVPDASRYAQFIAAPFQDFNTEHINHFSPPSLDNACGAAGFDLVSVDAKVDESAPGVPYPVLFGFWRRGEGARPAERDVALRGQIQDYIDRSRTIMDRYDGRIRALLAGHDEVIVWGTGQLTMKLLAETSLGEGRIAAFVDGNPVNHGRSLRGVAIVAPDALDPAGKPILVASTIHFNAILRGIRARWGDEVEVVGLEEPTP